VTTKTPDQFRSLSPQDMVADGGAAKVVARLTRKGRKEAEPVRVATFNSRI